MRRFAVILIVVVFFLINCASDGEQARDEINDLVDIFLDGNGENKESVLAEIVRVNPVYVADEVHIKFENEVGNRLNVLQAEKIVSQVISNDRNNPTMLYIAVELALQMESQKICDMFIESYPFNNSVIDSRVIDLVIRIGNDYAIETLKKLYEKTIDSKTKKRLKSLLKIVYHNDIEE
jgi:hypothetical protein